VKAVLGTVSARVNDEDLNRVLASLKGKPLHELISNGIKKLGGSALLALLRRERTIKRRKERRRRSLSLLRRTMRRIRLLHSLTLEI
jgi:hypothetical protein